jgi:hypothetical protein
MGCDEGGLIPQHDLMQLDQLRSRIGLMLELVDADRCEYGHDGSVGTALRHLLCSACERPSAPVKTDKHRRGGAKGYPKGYPLQKTGRRVSLQI